MGSVDFEFIVLAALVYFCVGLFGGTGPYALGTSAHLSRAKIRLFSTLNCLSGGVLLAAGFVHMLPDMMEDARLLNTSGPSPFVVAMLGLLIPFLCEKSAVLHCVTGGRDLHDIFDHGHADRKGQERKADGNDAKINSMRKNHHHKHHEMHHKASHKSPPSPVPQATSGGATISIIPPASYGSMDGSSSFSLAKSATGGGEEERRKSEVDEADMTFIQVNTTTERGITGDKYRIPIQRGCCNRGEGVHFTLKARCINCKTTINSSNEPHPTGHCPTVMFPSQSLMSIALQPVRGQKQDIVEDIFIRHRGGSKTTISYLLVTILSIHSLCAGMSFGTNRDLATAVGLLIAIVCHKAFAGFALGMSFRQNDVLLRQAIWGILVFSSMTPFGVFMGYTASNLVSGASSKWLSMIFKGVAAGTFIYIALVEILLEEFEGKDDKALKLVGFAAGATAMTILGYYI
mmetsp:Transcript_19602/g.36900  ORF Transcript_19602/g.36900 Transcript_19602/m.36900 type:complete len:460 (-) Transcript_19602:175-1554(-)